MAKKIRICHLITELAPAGAERCVYELATRLDRERFDVHVIGLRGGQVATWLERAGVPVHVLNMRGKWDLPRMAGLVGLLRRLRPDILHTHLFHADLAGRLASYEAKVPHLVHTVHVAEARFRPWHFAHARLTAERCDRIVAVSQSVRNFHARRSGLPLNRYQVIYNGVDAKACAFDAAARQQLRQQWGVGDSEVLLGFVGRLDKQKGIDVLLSAMSHMGARESAMRLVIAGDGPQRFLVENFIAHGEGGTHTRYLGFVNDVRGVLSATDIVLMPSRWEGFGLVAAEAMAAGRPVIATRVAGLTDIVDDAGILIGADQVVELTEAIEALAANPGQRAALGQAGLERVTQHFTIESNIAAHAALYEQIVQTQRPSAGDAKCQ